MDVSEKELQIADPGEGLCKVKKGILSITLLNDEKKLSTTLLSAHDLSEASVAQNKIGKKKDRLSKNPRVLHLKAELQDRDTFQTTISGKGHMYAYKIIPESSAFVPQLSPNGAIVLPGQLAP